ncbi:MAG: TonB-dependent receptor [Xenophilus sp.]
MASSVARAQETDESTNSNLPTVTVQDTAADTSIQHLNAQVQAGALGQRSQTDTPFSSAVVTAADIESRQVTKLGDLFSTDASVVDNSSANSAWASYLIVRGLALDWQNSYRIDGNPFLSYATVLPYEHFEQVELLKGASGFMYGFGSPGGLVNYVTKKPTDKPVRSVTFGYGSRGVGLLHADLGGRAGANGILGWRLNVTREAGKTYNQGSLRRSSLSLALDARLAPGLTWDFQTLIQDRKTEGQEPTFYTGLLSSGSLPSPVRNTKNLVHSGTYVDNHFRYYATGLKYDLAPDWTARLSYSHSSTHTRRNESVLMPTDSQGNYVDYASDYAEAYQYNQLQAMVEGKLRTGGVEHALVLGASWDKHTNDYSGDGVYSYIGTGSLWQPNTNAYFSSSSLHMYRASEITQKALFASDTLKLSDRWSALVGLRSVNYAQTGFSTTGVVSSSYSKKGVLTPTLALMYRLQPQTMLYGSYVESLEPGSTVGNTYANRGALLDPLKSRQYEIGAKTQREDWSATAALFRIEKKTEYANSANVLVQDGEELYQGLELSASTRLSRQWDLGGSLQLLDSEYRKGSSYAGNRVAGAPRATVAAQLGYAVPAVPGLRLRAGVKYTGRAMLRPANDITVPGYALLDLGATYDTRLFGYDTTFRLAVNNATDKRYWLFQYANYVKAGDPRTFSLNATVRF